MSPEPLWPTQPQTLDTTTMQSLLLEAGALRRGHAALRLRPHTLIVTSGAETAGFHGMLTSSTSHAAVAACANRLRLRTRLACAGLPQPRARTFRLADIDGAIAHAQRCGAEAHVQLADRTVLPQTSSSIRAGDGDLSTATATWSAQLAPETRILVTEPVEGACVRVVLVGGHVVSVLRSDPGSAWGPEVYRAPVQEETGAAEIHPDLLALARRAAAALPPTPHAVVTMTCPTLAAATGSTITAVDATLDLLAGDPPAHWTAFILDQIIGHATASTGADRVPARDRVSAALTLTGLLDPPATRRTVQDWAGASPLTGDCTAEPPDGLHATFTGTPGDLALLSVQLLTGAITDDVPETVAWTPAPDHAR